MKQFLYILAVAAAVTACNHRQETSTVKEIVEKVDIHGLIDVEGRTTKNVLENLIDQYVGSRSDLSVASDGRMSVMRDTTSGEIPDNERRFRVLGYLQRDNPLVEANFLIKMRLNEFERSTTYPFSVSHVKLMFHIVGIEYTRFGRTSVGQDFAMLDGNVGDLAFNNNARMIAEYNDFRSSADANSVMDQLLFDVGALKESIDTQRIWGSNLSNEGLTAKEVAIQLVKDYHQNAGDITINESFSAEMEQWRETFGPDDEDYLNVNYGVTLGDDNTHYGDSEALVKIQVKSIKRSKRFPYKTTVELFYRIAGFNFDGDSESRDKQVLLGSARGTDTGVKVLTYTLK